jgi:hypothetical protein
VLGVRRLRPDGEPLTKCAAMFDLLSQWRRIDVEPTGIKL